MKHTFTRRDALRATMVGGLGLAASGLVPAADAVAQPLKSNLKHSVARWTFGQTPIAELCRTVRQIGFSAIDLVGPDDWATLRAHDVDSSMCNGAELGLEQGGQTVGRGLVNSGMLEVQGTVRADEELQGGLGLAVVE